MVTTVTVTNSADKCLAVWIKKRIFAPHINQKTMIDKKEHTMLELASDDSAMQLLRSIAHNWEVAASRMEQINQERDQALGPQRFPCRHHRLSAGRPSGDGARHQVRRLVCRALSPLPVADLR